MFNQAYDGDGNEVTQVEFHRNNSQEVTGEGDAQRIFATVLDAIQKYIKKYKPQKLSFSASKSVDMDADDNGAKFNPESRAKLYDRLVQRYARAWGYRAFRADNGDIVIYELSRLKQGLAEAKTTREDFEGMTIEMVKNGHVLVINALDDWGNNILGSVAFNIGDDNDLDPQDLKVDERYQGQGIARIMYDYVKSKGYEIHRSYDQTDAGKGFWDKHRGEEQRVWEDVPQPGASSGAPKQFGPDAKIQTRQMTVKEIIASIPGLPYYNNVVDDYDAKDYSWGVTQKVMEYATYLKQHPESLAKLPPILVLNGKFEDGAHRVSAIWLLQQRMDPKNPLWANAKLNVQFVKQGVAENFHDGRNPQDKGDSKRHGVPTKASISTLRKVAKQGGRKGQLAHWMANMKSGRAKAKRK
jgi:GNAT superfamily N-acetyltransferase